MQFELFSDFFNNLFKTYFYKVKPVEWDFWSFSKNT